MFLRNAWYVAMHSSALADELVALTVLGEPLVFYRTVDGRAAALEDACPHRKLPLSMGRRRGDCIQCGYHGLTFDRHGTCVAAPTQGRIPQRARVRSYAVDERYGLVWVWMGERERADPATILAIPDYGDPAWGLTDGGVLECACHYLWLLDNLLDPSHVAWVHESTFASAGTEDVALRIEDDAQGVVVSRWIENIDPPPYYAPRLKFAGRIDRLQYYAARFPSIAVNMSTFTRTGTGGFGRALPDDAYRMRSYHFLTPVDEGNTRYHWFQHFNTDPHDETVRRELNQGTRLAFEEDRVVLEAVHRGMAGKTTPSIDLRLDEGARRFRRVLQALIAAETVAAQDTALSGSGT